MKAHNTMMESRTGRVFQYARRIALSTPGKLLLAGAVMFSLISITLPTKADARNEHGRNGHDRNEQRTLTGNWLVTVTRINPPPTLPPTFLSLMTCFEDGNVSEESNTTSIRSTGHGNWERTGRQEFARSINYFRFDAARNYLGMGRITATITLSEDGSQFVAEAAVENYDVSGNLVTTLHSTELGQRL